MKLETIETKKSTIEYCLVNKTGSPTLVFLHGLGANQEQFSGQCAYFSQDFQVLTLNVRGHGESRSTEPFTLAGCAQDLVDLLDALDIKRCHFVGNSMGGNIGYELLNAYEDRLLSMTTFGTTAELNTSKAMTQILTLTYKLLPMSLVASLASGSGLTANSKRFIKDMMGKMKKETLLAIIPVLAQFNYLNVIANSETSFLIIRGAKDAEINKVLPSTLAALEKRGGFNLIDLENAGHFANLDNPLQFNAMLDEFLNAKAIR